MYIIINMSRICQNKLPFWKQSCYGYTYDLGKAGLFNYLEGLGIQNDDIPLEINYFERNVIGLLIHDIELSRILTKLNDILEVTIDLDMAFRGKRIIEILRDIQT